MSTYAKIEHGLYENPKIVGLSDKAFRAYIESILYSGNHLTDGFLDERIVRRHWGDDVAEELSTNDPVNPSWQRVDGGWQIYGFCERQNTRDEIKAMKQRKSNAGIASAKARADKKSTEAQQAVEHVLNTTATEVQPDTDTDTDTDTSTRVERETLLPADWQPTDEHARKAKEKHLDLNQQAELFRLHAETHGRKAKRWNAAFSMWLTKANPGVAPKPDSDAWMNRHQKPGYVKPAWMTGDFE